MRTAPLAAAPLATMMIATMTATAIVVTAVGCRQRASRAESGAPFVAAWSLDRRVVGRATLNVTLRESSGAPIVGATVRVEGHMTHAGMAPIQATATASDRARGVYHTDIEFTMAGDWVLLVTAMLPDGRRVEQRIDVPNVQPAT